MRWIAENWMWIAGLFLLADIALTLRRMSAARYASEDQDDALALEHSSAFEADSIQSPSIAKASVGR